MLKGLHHSAYRCRDSEETRKFYEDFLGLKLAHVIEISETIVNKNDDVISLKLVRAIAILLVKKLRLLSSK